MMEKLLIIGAGIGQIPIIKKAKSRGIHVTVVTLPGNHPGLDIADDVFYCDIYERDSIVAWARDNGITAVTSDQNDLMNPTVAYVAEKLGLPGNKFEQVMSYCNKNTYRDNCDKLGIPVPKHIAISSDDYNPDSFDAPLPWIIKPADSQSSVGVQKIETLDDFKPALKFALEHSKTHGAILEEFFAGHEIVCEGFIEDGKYYLLAFADRKYFSLKDLMIPSQTVFPSLVKPEILSKVLECEQKMAAYIKPSFAIVHSEYLVNEATGEIRVVESALRGGGVYISSHLIPLATGIDINEVLLDKVMGNKVNVADVIANGFSKAAGYVCFYLPEGFVSKVSGVDELEKLPFVKMVKLDKIEVGQKTEPMLHKGLRKGPILVYGEVREDLERNIKIVQDTLNIEVTGLDGKVRGIVWR